jgi:integrase/recombinase XerD
MADLMKLGPWVRRFLLEHLMNERNLSRGTQRSYRDTLSLLIPFVARKTRKSVDALDVVHVSADLVRLFLLHLEESRGCAISTRNQRLAAIHALAHFVALHSPEHIAWCGEICVIPFRRCSQTPGVYLEKVEIDALLAAPNLTNAQGQRDHLLLFVRFLAVVDIPQDLIEHVFRYDAQRTRFFPSHAPDFCLPHMLLQFVH